MPDSRFLTLSDVADILNISPHQAYTLVRTGDLPGIQIGGRTVTDRVMDDNHQYKIFFEPLSQERTVRYRDVDAPAR